MKTLILATAALAASATASLACVGISCPPPDKVPEISALDGAAAIALLAAVVAVLWERTRRV